MRSSDLNIFAEGRNRINQFRRKKIGILRGGDSILPKRLLDAVGSIYHVEFVLTEDVRAAAGLDAALLFGVSRDEAEAVARQGVRTMAFLHEVSRIGRERSEILFSTTPYLAECLRGRKLADKSLTHAARLAQKDGDEVVAYRDGEPFWLHRSDDSLGRIDLVAAQSDDLTEGDYLYKHLEQEDWVRLLPLLHFSQEVSGWNAPPIRACLMFDDPNLHWSSYGYIRYAELARHAAEHNYHAAFAMIPMDSWYVHKPTARLFRENSDRLSLLFHGNNHTYYELTQTATTASRESLAAQAIRRVERFERASGLRVPRAMAAPHGACSVAMGDALLRSGFEVACISRSSLMNRNPEVVWPATVGMNPAEFLGEGLPVIPRFNIRWSTSYALFAAFLGQPIILVGHHDDLADGLDLLAHWADFINSFGVARWCDVTAMSRANFRTRRIGDLLEVEMFSRKIEFVVPPDCSRVRVSRPWLMDSSREKLTVSKRPGDNEESFAVEPGENISVASDYPDVIDVSRVATSLPGPWPVARRQLCEVRDRLRPLLDRFNRAKQTGNHADPFSQAV